MSNQSVRVISSEKQGIAGFLAGFTGIAITYPLDLIKTRFQSSQYNHYTSSLNAIRKITRTHGIRGLFVGVEASIIGSSVAWGAYFYLYAKIKNELRTAPNHKLSSSQHLISSFIAGAVTQTITNPIWVVKTNLQLNKSSKLWTNVKDIYCQRGIMGFWRGILPSMFGVCQASIHFVVYERIKYMLQERRNGFMTPLEVISNTIFAKSISLIITYPYQVLRTRLQHIQDDSHKIL
eukprot:143820_1